MTERSQRLRENNVKNGRPTNSRLPYSIEEIELIARTAPTKENRIVLAEALGRSENAIGFIWWLLSCSVKYLKQSYDGPHIDKIIQVKKRVGYCISNTPTSPRADIEIN